MYTRNRLGLFMYWIANWEYSNLFTQQIGSSLRSTADGTLRLRLFLFRTWRMDDSLTSEPTARWSSKHVGSFNSAKSRHDVLLEESCYRLGCNDGIIKWLFVINSLLYLFRDCTNTGSGEAGKQRSEIPCFTTDGVQNRDRIVSPPICSWGVNRDGEVVVVVWENWHFGNINKKGFDLLWINRTFSRPSIFLSL